MCLDNKSKSERYHWGVWSGKRWSCCRLSNRSASGCNPCSSWSRASLTSLLRQPSTESIINNNPTRLSELGKWSFLFSFGRERGRLARLQIPQGGRAHLMTPAADYVSRTAATCSRNRPAVRSTAFTKKKKNVLLFSRIF